VAAAVGIPRWHARGQGFKSPQLHPRSEAPSAVDRPRIARLGQQIGSNLPCEADPASGSAVRRPASLVSSPGRSGPPLAAPGGRDEGPD
jgi:hypothetical protein